MQGIALRIVAALSLSLAVACTTGPEISFDERVDFGRYRTWDWFPDAARAIDTATPYTRAEGLDHDLARLVERELARRGFERTRLEPDLRVGVRLVVRREEVTRYETGAIQQLSSLHHSPSYQVQSTVARRQTYERSRLALFAIDARRGSVVWQATLEERFRGRFSPHLERTIASLLGRFPPAGHKANESPAPTRDPATGRPSEFTGSPTRSAADAS